MDIGAKLGAEQFYEYLKGFGFMSKTGIDLPGEAVGIFHKVEKVGPVELATMSFGQSLQITAMQLLRAGSAIVNGGQLITPHVGLALLDNDGMIVEEFLYDKGNAVISPQTSETMKTILESVVSAGTGAKTYIPGYRVGGKTATSEKLPRRQGKYIASFLALAPAENPQVIAFVLIDEPQGTYYGGQVAGPVMKEVLSNALPYLGIEPIYNEKEQTMPEVVQVEVPDLVGIELSEAKKILTTLKFDLDLRGDPNGWIVTSQFPQAGTPVNPGAAITLYVGEEF